MTWTRGSVTAAQPSSLSLPLPPSLLLQVLPHVLHVCEPGLCPADSSQDAKLETSLSILPLVGWSVGAERYWYHGVGTEVPSVFGA